MSLAVAVSDWLSMNIISWAHGDSWEWDTSALFTASVGLMDSFHWERHHCWLMWGDSTGSKRGALKISFDTSKGETFARNELNWFGRWEALMIHIQITWDSLLYISNKVLLHLRQCKSTINSCDVLFFPPFFKDFFADENKMIITWKWQHFFKQH